MTKTTITVSPLSHNAKWNWTVRCSLGIPFATGQISAEDCSDADAAVEQAIDECGFTVSTAVYPNGETLELVS